MEDILSREEKLVRGLPRALLAIMATAPTE